MTPQRHMMQLACIGKQLWDVGVNYSSGLCKQKWRSEVYITTANVDTRWFGSSIYGASKGATLQL